MTAAPNIGFFQIIGASLRDTVRTPTTQVCSVIKSDSYTNTARLTIFNSALGLGKRLKGKG